MNRTKLAIVDTFWQLLEEKPYNYHFQDIPFLAEWSVEMWTDEVIKDRGDFESLTHCIVYMAEECTKRKKALLHLYRSSKKEYFLEYLNKMGHHIICSYVENRTGNLSMKENRTGSFVRYYKCTFVGIILDWLEDAASYDLVEFCQEVCELFSGSGEKALLKCVAESSKKQ